MTLGVTDIDHYHALAGEKALLGAMEEGNRNHRRGFLACGNTETTGRDTPHHLRHGLAAGPHLLPDLMTKTVIVVPCFNEADRLMPDAFRDFARDWRHGVFLFVDDGSTDNTLSLLTALQKSAPGSFAVLQLPRNGGKAEAVRQGILEAFRLSPEYVGFWDADLATPLDVLPLFEAVFRDRPQTEIVLGARVQLLGRDIHRRTLRHYLGRGFATAVAIVLSVNVYDSQCGAKMFRVTDSVRGLFNRPFLSRWVFDVEILARFVKAERIQGAPRPEALLYELPLPSWRDVGGSKVRAKDFVTALFDLVRICRSLR